MFAYFHYSSIIFKQIINILSRIINIINRKRDNNAIILFLFTAATASLSLEVNAEEQNPKRIEVTADTENAITNALKDAVSGDTLIIHAGEYKEQVCITTSNLTIKAEEGAILNGEYISLENESEVKSDSMVYIEADNVSISGLEIKGLKLHHISNSKNVRFIISHSVKARLLS